MPQEKTEKRVEGRRGGTSNPNWKGGLPGCIDCYKKLSRREYKRCFKCSRNLQKGNLNPNWKGGKPKCMDCDKKLSSRKHKRCLSCAKKGILNYGWKGDNVGYDALHDYIKRYLGFPEICWECGTKKSKKYEWANISGLYKRDFKDWKRLCVKCHRKFDNHLLAKGENHYCSKLKINDVLEIRRLYKKNKYGVPRLAKKFNTAISTTWAVVNRITWKHI